MHFRNRIGTKGIEQILQKSIRINGKDAEDKDVRVDTTVQGKNIRFPSDDKLYKKIIAKCHQIVKEEQLPIRQSYTRTLKKLRYNRPLS